MNFGEDNPPARYKILVGKQLTIESGISIAPGIIVAPAKYD